MKAIVMDTNVLFSGLYSRQGASYKILENLLIGNIRLLLSTALLFEYEDVLKRNQALLGLSDKEIEVILDTLCAYSQFHKVYFLWRPYLPDAKVDMVLELAVTAQIKTIVTHNLKDFVGIEKFAIKAQTPKTFLETLT